MQDTGVFEKFLDTKYGQDVLERFNKEKRFIENPADIIVRKSGRSGIRTYLDIGAGTGVRTLKIMKGLGIKSVDFLEPSKKAPEAFLQKTAGYDVNVITSSFEEFNTNKKYDFITSVHTWYYIGLGALRKLYNLLKPGGTAAIFIDSEDDTIKRIQDICETRFWKGKTINAENICRFLDKTRIKYKIYKDNRKFSGLLKDGNFTERTKTIMSLVSYTRWEDIPDSTKLSVKKLLESISSKDVYPSRRWLIVIKK